MGLQFYLAMDPSEMQRNFPHRGAVAWFSCQFSREGESLSNLPQTLPEGSALILDDACSFPRLNTQAICSSLEQTAARLRLQAVVLDFQRPYMPRLGELASVLEGRLPCPVVVSRAYAAHTKGPVLMEPIPPDARPENWLASAHRPVWLELDNRTTRLVLTPQGLQRSFLTDFVPCGKVFTDKALCCHYQLRADSEPTFTLFRTKEDLTHLLRRLEALGVEAAIGLYQELKPLLTENG